MPTFKIYYTITQAGHDEIEAETLEKAIEKWEENTPGEAENGGIIEYDPFTQENYDWEEVLKKEQESKT